MSHLPSENSLPRSPELMNAHDTALLVIDVQEKIMRAIAGSATLVWNIRRLIDGAGILGVPVEATEQAPEKLGPTVESLRSRLPEAKSKLAFSCGERGEIAGDWQANGLHRVLLCGVETHVCVQQTAFDFMAAGFRVYAAVDALGSRNAIDHQTALRRLESGGVTLTTCEAALTEWAVRAGTEQFKKISALAKEHAPKS
ncbi:MAG: isochorismatase family protein [Planctomycetota bacterium]